MEHTPYDAFVRQFKWNQGEHIAVIGPTGVGKTTLMRELLLPRRRFNIFFGTKRKDKLYNSILRLGYDRMESVRDIRSYHEKVILWPRHAPTIRQTVARQKKVFQDAFDKIAESGGWTAYYDECKYMAQMLNLGLELTFCQEQLRSNHGTNVSGAQRPVFLPRSVLSNATHVFLWKTTDADDIKRLSDIGGVDRTMIRKELATLGDYEFLYIKTRGANNEVLRSQVRM